MLKVAVFLNFIFSFSLAQAAPPLPSGLDDECLKFIASLPSTYDYGFLNVPEDFDHPSTSRTVRVFYYRWKVPAENTSAPVIFYNGGPGDTSHEMMPTWSRILPKYKIPFLTIDQRGTGCSTHYPSTFKEYDRLKFYGSRGIIADSEAIRKKLYGGRKWKVFGQSFGGFVVHRYMTLHPEALAGAFAHGMAISRNPLGEFYFRAEAQHRISSAYLANHADVEALLEQVRSRINSKTCFSKGTFATCGEGAWDGVLVYLFNGNLIDHMIPELKTLITASGELDLKILGSLVDRFVMSLYAPNAGDSPLVVTPSISPKPRIAIRPTSFAPVELIGSASPLDPYVSGPGYIGEMEMTPNFDPNDPDNCLAINARLIKEGNDIAKWPVNECRFVLSMHFGGAAANGSGANPPDGDALTLPKAFRDLLTLDMVENAIRANLAVPFNLYSGALDAFVPAELFAEEATDMKDLIRYRNFPNSGHEGFFTEPQVWTDLGERQ